MASEKNNYNFRRANFDAMRTNLTTKHSNNRLSEIMQR